MAKCGTTVSRLPFSQMYPLLETSHGQVWHYSEQADLQSDVTPHRCMRLQARFAFGQMSDQVNIMSDVPPD